MTAKVDGQYFLLSFARLAPREVSWRRAMFLTCWAKVRFLARSMQMEQTPTGSASGRQRWISIGGEKIYSQRLVALPTIWLNSIDQAGHSSF